MDQFLISKKSGHKRRIAKGVITTPDGAEVEYVQFGRGPVPVVTIPGAGDGLNTVKKAALQLAFLYRKRRQHCRMTIFSRRIPYPAGFGVEALAQDFIYAVEQLGIKTAVWELNSAGGPVGQQVAFQRPDLVQGMVFTSTLHRMTASTQGIIAQWIAQVRAGAWPELMWDTIQRTYSEQRVRRYRLIKPLLPILARPSKYADRFVYLLQDLYDVDHRDQLPHITCPVWVSHGKEDQIIPPTLAREAADLLPNRSLTLYPKYGHGNEIENPAYLTDFLDFIAQFA
jgi:pimeloyl-ACP methyl ester carboxylesterase